MLYCIAHGRAHYRGEADDATLLGDDLPCIEEEWDVVGGTTLSSHCEQRSEPSPLVMTGSLAYLTSVAAGMVPVKVVEVRDYEADVKVTAARAGFPRGSTITLHLPNHTLVARDQVYRRRGVLRVNGPTSVMTKAGDLR